MTKEFNKNLMIDNIFFLLKDVGKKIDDLETDVGVCRGYISRLSQEENANAEIEFIMTVAKYLNTSMDTLLNISLTHLTFTERYLVTFLDKLYKDTLDDKLDWIRESADQLNRAESDKNRNSPHPILCYETVYEMNDTGSPKAISTVVFLSNSFSRITCISGDCFNLRLKNGSRLYIMNICNGVQNMNNPDTYAKEIWMYTPRAGAHYLCSNNKSSPMVDLINNVYAMINDRMKTPRIKKDVQMIIEAFLNDDLSNDEREDEMPF